MPRLNSSTSLGLGLMSFHGSRFGESQLARASFNPMATYNEVSSELVSSKSDSVPWHEIPVVAITYEIGQGLQVQL